ncbi:MAG: 16S rRNA (uracil(1498)-N(3))-methyltransferase [candidate division Zixibacteria bacterium]|nr:16S rRNA (uracil(1498)-N(3))-methyltransferase [candidate division Zixibacteria bacterium]MDH3937507.1 16S rRNA (uracil(1498)-N(3))-methyltransferase [candidate division Zixibacteria bacterium]MDH4034419.1 16S rRNA (uracil(1498)-N(3))-methyltransferase [candidate division Zixibacteria bacterium]
MNLAILTANDAIGDDRFRLTDARADHIRSVLKLTAGDSVEVGLLDGPQGTAKIESCDDQGVVIFADSLENAPLPAPTVDIICALPRPQTLKKILLTSAMMGVRRLYLVRANRVEKSYYQSPLLQPENYRPYLLEGLSQGKLTRMPQVTIHDRFRVFFEDTLKTLYNAADSAEPRMLLPDSESSASLSDVVSGEKVETTTLVVGIGPEGGWVPFEVELMEGIGFRPFSLGRWTLRVEHAVTAVLSQLELLRMNSCRAAPS